MPHIDTPINPDRTERAATTRASANAGTAPGRCAGLLRQAMQANAVFSIATGGLLAAAPGTVGDWLGVSVDGWLRLLGLALIGHAAVLGWASTVRDPRQLGRLNFFAIAPYPAMMAALVVTGLVDRTLGQGLVLADGAVVGAIAIGHWVGLRKAGPTAQAQAV